MPGSPHPANVITDDALVDLVHFVHSLGKEPKRALTNHERTNRAYRRPVLSQEAE